MYSNIIFDTIKICNLLLNKKNRKTLIFSGPNTSKLSLMNWPNNSEFDNNKYRITD